MKAKVSLADRIVPPVPQGYSNQEDGYVVLWRGFLDWHKNLLANIARLERGIGIAYFVSDNRGGYRACFSTEATHMGLVLDMQPIDAADQELRDRGYSEKSIAAVKAGLESAKAGRISKRAENFGTSSARIEESGETRCNPNNVYSDDRCKQAAERLRELAESEEGWFIPGPVLEQISSIADSLDPRPEPACEHAPARSGNYGNGEPNNIWYEMRCYKCGAEIRPSSWASRTAETSKHRVETMPLTDEERAMLAEDEDASKTEQKDELSDEMRAVLDDLAPWGRARAEQYLSQKQPKNDASDAPIESGHESRFVPDAETVARLLEYEIGWGNEVELFQEAVRWALKQPQPGSDLAVAVDELLGFLRYCEHSGLVERIEASQAAGHPTGVCK